MIDRALRIELDRFFVIFPGLIQLAQVVIGFGENVIVRIIVPVLQQRLETRTISFHWFFAV